MRQVHIVTSGVKLMDRVQELIGNCGITVADKAPVLFKLTDFIQKIEHKAFKRGNTHMAKESYVKGMMAAALIGGSKCPSTKGLIEKEAKRLHNGGAAEWIGIKY